MDQDWLRPGADVTFPMGVLKQWPPKTEQWHGIVRAVHGDQITVSYEHEGREIVSAFSRAQLKPAS